MADHQMQPAQAALVAEARGRVVAVLAEDVVVGAAGLQPGAAALELGGGLETGAFGGGGLRRKEVAKRQAPEEQRERGDANERPATQGGCSGQGTPPTRGPGRAAWKGVSQRHGRRAERVGPGAG